MAVTPYNRPTGKDKQENITLDTDDIEQYGVEVDNIQETTATPSNPVMHYVRHSVKPFCLMLVVIMLLTDAHKIATYLSELTVQKWLCDTLGITAYRGYSAVELVPYTAPSIDIMLRHSRGVEAVQAYWR